MITRITNIEELKRIFTEILLNKTDKVSKISDSSILNALGYGVGKLGQKSLKDMAIIESHLFPDSATGDYLDRIANLQGVAPRFNQSQSTTYVRVVGDQGTTYNPTIHVFKGGGIDFIPEEIKTIGVEGFAYIKVKSLDYGFKTNIDPLQINEVTPIPSGHEYCVNEFRASGGRDFESDENFSNRIKEEINSLSRNTISYLEQIFRKLNPEILRVYNLGNDNLGNNLIGISKVNGSQASESEIDEIVEKGSEFLSINELKVDGGEYKGLKIVNIPYFPIDVSARVVLDNSYNFDEIRSEIQVNMNSILDLNNWEDGGIIDWIDIINAIKSVEGVTRVLDNYFYPNTDIIVPKGMLPRFRGFSFMNLSGQIIEDQSGNLQPIYYPNENDFSFQSTVLRSI